ncbi:hypothetical protein APUTEX25_000785, partial [Auxenochlorella protothecoides]
ELRPPCTLVAGLLLALISSASAQLGLGSQGNVPTCNTTVSVDSLTSPGGVSSCIIVTNLFPRQCGCVANTCNPSDPYGSVNCNICLRGWGIYSSIDECMGAGEVVINADPVYPDPTYPTPTCPSTAPTADGRTDCPFLASGLKRWNDPATWGGTVPSPGTSITLPANSKVLLSGCMISATATYTQVIIPATSEVILDDNTLVWNLGSIDVYGALRGGSATCRLNSRLTFLFHTVNGISTFLFGIRVRPGGTIQLHGALYTPTWTRLGASITPGSTQVTLKEAVNWQPGQQVAISTTIWRDAQNNQNEVRTIQSVSADGKTLTLTAGTQFYHYGGAEYQAEVGLLSRNILIAGEASMDSTKLGPHIRIEGGGSISGTQVYRGGQYNVMGAYPFHYHLIGNGAGMTLSDNSVYKSYFRCYVVHATSFATLKNNVAFNSQGHCYYLEDGVEEQNVIDRNLAMFVNILGTAAAGIDQSGVTLTTSGTGLENPSDSSAAGFYITNPYNTLTNNAASGGYSGFFYPVLPAPIGLSRSTQLVPSQRPLLKFDSNTAHSSGYYWENAGCIYFGGKLYYNGNDLTYYSGRVEFDTRALDGVTKGFMDFTNTKSFLCMSGHMSWGARMQLLNYTAYDIVRGATMFGSALIQDGYIQYSSANPNSAFPGATADLPPAAGFQWYDTSTQTIIADTTFANYTYQPSLGTFRPSVFYGMTHSDEFKPLYMSVAKDISYVNVDYDAIMRLDVKQTGASRMFNFIGWDGSVTLSTGPQIVGGWPTWWNLASDCFFQGNWNTWTCPQRDAQIPARLEFRIPGYTNQWGTGTAASPDPSNYIGFISQFGYQGTAARSMVITRNEGITGVTGTTGWYTHIDSGAPKTFQLYLTQLLKGTSIIFATRYPAGTTFTISRQYQYYPGNNVNIGAATSLSALVSNAMSTYFFDGTYLYIKVVDPGDAETEDSFFSRAGAFIPGTRYFSGESWMLSGDYCAQTCGRQTWMIEGNYCARLVSQSNPVPQPATDHLAQPLPCPVTQSFAEPITQPSGILQTWMIEGNYCARESFMTSGNYCQITCGRCPTASPSAAANSILAGSVSEQSPSPSAFAAPSPVAFGPPPSLEEDSVDFFEDEPPQLISQRLSAPLAPVSQLPPAEEEDTDAFLPPVAPITLTEQSPAAVPDEVLGGFEEDDESDLFMEDKPLGPMAEAVTGLEAFLTGYSCDANELVDGTYCQLSCQRCVAASEKAGARLGNRTGSTPTLSAKNKGEETSAESPTHIIFKDLKLLADHNYESGEEGTQDQDVSPGGSIKITGSSGGKARLKRVDRQKLIVILVGLPARGKTFLCNKLMCYLNWLGHPTRHFNVGMYRRNAADQEEKHDAAFFDPGNAKGQEVRHRALLAALDDMEAWLATGSAQVAVIDATNTTEERREELKCRFHGTWQYLFIESICNDEVVLHQNYKWKMLYSPDYKNMDPKEAWEDFTARIKKYEAIYETITDRRLHYIKLIDMVTGKGYMDVNRISGYIPGKMVFFLMQVCKGLGQRRRIWLTRHGESEYNTMGKIGGNSGLSLRGQVYARLLPQILMDRVVPLAGSAPPPVAVWTSTLARTIITASGLPFPKVQWKALDEIQAGICEGMTYREIAARLPGEYELRRRDKLRYRYPSGESYMDVIQRLDPVISEVERERECVCIVAHQAVLRALYGYFMNRPLAEVPSLNIPLHTIMELTPQPDGTMAETRFEVDVDLAAAREGLAGDGGGEKGGDHQKAARGMPRSASLAELRAKSFVRQLDAFGRLSSDSDDPGRLMP